MSWLAAIAGRYRASADPVRTQRRIELCALLLGLGLCLQIAWGAVRLMALAPPAPVEPAADSVRVPPVQGLAMLAASERNEINSRPVFWPGRRPVNAAATLTDAGAADEKAGAIEGVKLVGVFGGEKSGIIALVKGAKRRILLGERLEGWTLESIHPTGGVLVAGARRETLTLQRGSVTMTAPPPASAVSPGDVEPEKHRRAQAAPVGGQPGAAGAAKPEAEPTLSLGAQG